MDNNLIKGIAISYALSQLLIKNMEYIVHEMKMCKDPHAGQMADKFDKLRSASEKAFVKLERELKDGDAFEGLHADIDQLMDEMWELKYKNA